MRKKTARLHPVQRPFYHIMFKTLYISKKREELDRIENDIEAAKVQGCI